MSIVVDYNLTRLKELPPSKWKKLRNKYLQDWPNNLVGYYTIDNFIRWIRLEPNIKNLKIYTLELILSQRFHMIDGTFLIVDRYQLFLNSLNQTNRISLKRALTLLDWSPGFKVSTFLDRHKSVVFEVIESKGLTLEWGNSCTPLAYFNKEKGAELELNCPDDIDLRPLTEKDSEIADAVWPNHHFGSRFLLKRLVKYNPSIGAFKRDTNELVAWCLQLQSGALGALQVKTDHMRKGYGSLVVRAISKCLAAKNCDTFACVNEDNIASWNTFKKCGFEFVDGCNWLRTNPTKPLDIDWEQE